MEKARNGEDINSYITDELRGQLASALVQLKQLGLDFSQNE